MAIISFELKRAQGIKISTSRAWLSTQALDVLSRDRMDAPLVLAFDQGFP
jgi:hypothetical protein